MPSLSLRRLLPLAVLLLTAAAFAASTASAATFTNRINANEPGDIAIIGNTLMTCPAGSTNAQGSCEAARNATSASGVGFANNDFPMAFQDVDLADGATSSSTASLSLPAESTVLFAGLYWGGKTATNPAPAGRDKLKLRLPRTSAYTEVTAQATQTLADGAYQQYANVTSLVSGAGSGAYTAAGIVAQTGADRYAGWALVVAYRDPAGTPRNLSVNDGLTVVSQNAVTADIDVSGFTTAPEGDVATTLGAIAYEGDQGKTGDGMKLGATPDALSTVSDAANPATDFFNSSIAVKGVRQTEGRSPAQANHFGFDADLIDAKGLLPNRATSAVLRVNTAASGGETIYPGVVTFASDLLAAKIRPVTTVEVDGGGAAEPGKELIYTTTAENTGNGDADELTLRSAIPAGVEVVPGSLQILEGAGSDDTDLTLAAGDDRAVYDTAGRTLNWRLGTGATPDTGGVLPVGQRVVVRYRVKIGAPANGSELPAGVNAAYGTVGTPDTYNVSGTGGKISVAGPDLVMDLTRTGDLVRGQTASYALSVKNIGAAAARDLVRVTDELPAALDPTGTPAGDGWDCSATTGRSVSCERTDPLAVGDTYPSVVVPVRVRQDATGAIVNAATVTGTGDGIHDNDSDADDGGVPFSNAAMALALSRDPATLSPGETATITATVSNGGPSDATGVQVALPLPAAFELVSATTGGRPCVETTCAVGTVTAAGTATATYVVRALAAGAGTEQSVTGTATTATPDTTTDDDSASATFTVRPQRRVSVAQQLIPSTLVAGAPAKLAIGVSNAGPSPATDVVLTEPVPAQLRDANSTVVQGIASCAVADGTLRCEIPKVDPGQTIELELAGTLRSSTAGQTFAATASVAPVELDVTTDDDSASVSRAITAAADLALTTVSAPSSLRAGEQGTFVFRAADGGPSDATGVTLRIPLPNGLKPIGTPQGADCTVAGGELVCTIGGLVSGTHRDVTVVLALPGDAPAEPLAIQPVLSGDQPDGDTNDATVQIGTSIGRQADVGVRVAAPVGELVAGRPVSYTATVGNDGPSDATDVVVTQKLPDGLTGVTGKVRDGAGTCAVAAGTITCRIARLVDGREATIDFTGTVAPGAAGQAIVPVVSVDAAESDPDHDDDRASTSATPVAQNDLSVTAFAPAGTVTTGQTAELTLVARNDGPSDASGVVLTTVLPKAAEVVTLDPRCTLAGQTITCTIGAVGVGKEAPVRIVVKARKPFDGALLGSASSVSGAGRDPQPANDVLAALAEPQDLPQCVSRRRFTIRLRVPARARLRSVTVQVGGKPVKVRVGKRLTAVVDLRGRPASRVVTRIVAVTKAGRRIAGLRAYQTCTVKRPTKRAPRI